MKRTKEKSKPKHKKKHRLRRWITTILLIPTAAITAFYFWAGGTMSSQTKYNEIISYEKSITPNHTNINKKNESTESIEPTNDSVTIMTYNIGYLSGMINNLPVKREKPFFQQNMENVVEMIKQYQPDIIGFQEIDFDSARSFHVDQLKTIAQQTGMPHGAKAVNWDKRYVPFPYWPPSVHFGKMLSGQAVLSKYRVQINEITVLQRSPKNPFYYNAFYLDRLAQMVKIETKQGRLTIINVHLEAFDGETREKQTETLLELYRRERTKGPVILMGDFNSVPPDAPQKKNFIDEPGTDLSTDKTLPLLLAEKTLEAAETKHMTFPTDKPTRKLDYFFYDKDTIQCLEVTMPRVTGSDHLPLIMKFKIKSTESPPHCNTTL